MKKILAIITLTIVLGMNSVNIGAQNTVLTGQIVETENYSPVNSASITIVCPEGSVITKIESNDNGLFELDGVPSGSYKMIVSYNGYKKTVYDLNVNSGMNDMGVIELDQDRRYANNDKRK